MFSWTAKKLELYFPFMIDPCYCIWYKPAVYHYIVYLPQYNVGKHRVGKIAKEKKERKKKHGSMHTCKILHMHMLPCWIIKRTKNPKEQV